MKTIKRYLWFIYKSQSYMQGYNPIWIFFESLCLGIGFCKSFNK
ncbi:hypothetical protein LBSP_21270 [Lentilactobacillus buchneri subsp. silagei]|nr:hypothetical protein LBSP_21270 [Lentilactobacillus buchneri subsp. silagei]